MTSTKLDKLEVVAGIANRLEDDLRQLKEWIKTQFEIEKEALNENGYNMTDFSTSSDPIDDNDDRTGQQPRVGYSGASNFSISESIHITEPKFEHIEGNGQELENVPRNGGEEFILGYEPEDPLDNGPNDMMLEFDPVVPHINQKVEDSRVECEICHIRLKNRNSLKKHRHYKHGAGAKKRASLTASTTTSKGPKKRLKNGNVSSTFLKKPFNKNCYICGENFHAHSSHYNHLQKKHLICPHEGCRLQFPSYQAILDHRKQTPLLHGQKQRRALSNPK